MRTVIHWQDATKTKPVPYAVCFVATADVMCLAFVVWNGQHWELFDDKRPCRQDIAYWAPAMGNKVEVSFFGEPVPVSPDQSPPPKVQQTLFE